MTDSLLGLNTTNVYDLVLLSSVVVHKLTSIMRLYLHRLFEVYLILPMCY